MPHLNLISHTISSYYRSYPNSLKPVQTSFTPASIRAGFYIRNDRPVCNAIIQRPQGHQLMTSSCIWMPDFVTLQENQRMTQYLFTEDPTLTGFEQLSIPQPDDYEGRVVTTLVRRRTDEPQAIAMLRVHGFNDYFFMPKLLKNTMHWESNSMALIYVNPAGRCCHIRK